MDIKRFIAPILFITMVPNILFTTLSGAQGVMPIHVPLRQTESDHFIYIYDQSLEDQMPGLIKSCEDAHTILTPVFHWVPKQKTIVMYSDIQDIHNGWATVYPRLMIMIYASDAPQESTIYEPGDYIRRTVFHEYAHILSNDAQYGLDATLTNIFGRVYPITGDPLSFALMMLSASPCLLAPPWYKEGLATWVETEFVGPGRGRSTRVDMILRMAVADNRLLKGNEWFFELPEWPYGDAAYLYGLKTMQYIHDHYGFQEQEKNTPGDISDSVAHSFMFVFNNRSISVTGKSFQTLVQEAMEAESARQTRRIEILKLHPLTPVQRLTPERLIVTEPKFGPGGETIYFSGREEADRNTLFRYNMNTKELNKLTSVKTTIPLFTDLAPSSDRNTLYYTRLDIQGRDRIRNELYRLDTQNDRSHLVAKKGRYRYPAVSPDGSRLAAVVNRGGTQSLVDVPIEKAGKKQFEKTLVQASLHHTLVDPTFSPDGEYIVYILADEKGSQLRSVNRQTNVDVELLKWPCIILSPIFHPLDQNLVFVSDRNGVYNLYRMPFVPHTEPVALTHVLGGIFSPDFSPDGTRLTATAYDSHGYYLTVLNYEEIQPLSSLPAIDDKWKSLQKNLALKEEVEKSPARKNITSDPYYSFSHMGFDFWSPWLTSSADGVMGGLLAAFSDPTQFQNLYMLAGAESHYETPVGALVYKYSGLYPVLTLYGTTMPEYYTDLIKDADNLYYDYDEEVQTAGIALSLPWLRVDWQGNLRIGYQVSDRSVIKESADKYKGKTLQTRPFFEGKEVSLWSQVDFFNATAFGRSHSYEDGRSITATVEWADESIDSDINRTRVRGDWHEFFRMPGFENQILKFECVYARGSGDKTAQGLFGLGGYLPMLTLEQGLNRNVSLRGYPANYQVGDEVVKGGVAYRFPIFRRYKNVNATSPFYLHQIFAEIFYEGGKAMDGEPGGRENAWIQSTGVEANLSTTLFRFLPIAPGVGVAYAFDLEDRKRAGEEEDTDEVSKLQVYITIKTTVNF